MALRKAAALGRRLGYLSHSEEQGGAGWLGGVTGEKLIDHLQNDQRIGNPGSRLGHLGTRRGTPWALQLILSTLLTVAPGTAATISTTRAPIQTLGQ